MGKDDKKKARGQRAYRQDRSSKSYKSDLEKLFESGSDVPDRFQDLVEGLGPEEGSEEALWLEAVAELRETEDLRAFVKATGAFLRAGHALPDDEALLGRMLEHPRESIVVQALNHLIDLHTRRTLKGSAALKMRLKSVKTVTDSPSVHELADQVLDALG